MGDELYEVENGFWECCELTQQGTGQNDFDAYVEFRERFQSSRCIGLDRNGTSSASCTKNALEIRGTVALYWLRPVARIVSKGEPWNLGGVRGGGSGMGVSYFRDALLLATNVFWLQR